MSETKNPGEKKLSVSGSKLTLKPRTETGVVRQSFSHGRSKQVVVEKVKRRSVGGPAEAKHEPAPVEAPAKPAAAAKAAAPARKPRPAEAPKASGVVLRTLTEEERAARAHALADSRVREAEERKIAEEEAKHPRQPRGRSKRPSAKPPKRASARKTSATSTTKKPSARPAKSPRSASARKR